MKTYFCFLISIFCSLFFITLSEAGITLRLIAVNPANIEQSVPVKVYLPMEVKPEDVIYKEDLQIAYDTQQGSYYVYGEYILQPKEVLEKEIEIKDIWVIDELEVVSLRQEAGKIVEEFKKTNYYDRAQLLQQSIEKKLQGISTTQRSSPVSPGDHISNYRNSLSLLNSAKADLLAAKTLLSEVGPKGLAKFTWKIIIFIIGFLGVLGAGFFFIWQRQSKLETEESPKP